LRVSVSGGGLRFNTERFWIEMSKLFTISTY
jgi:hypothetical protein